MRKNPTELKRALTLHQVYMHQYPLCRYDSKCLSKAIRNGWKGFSCRKCSFFRKYQKIRQQRNEIRMVYMQEVWKKNYIL